MSQARHLVIFCFVLKILLSCNSKEVRYEYYPNGAKKSECIESDQCNRCKFFYENGAIQAELLYTNGKLNGVNNYFFKNGQPSQIVTYKKGLRHGPYEVFYENGNVAERGHFYYQMRRGKVIKFYPEYKGKPMYEYYFLSYDSTEFISKTIRYGEDGKVIKVDNSIDISFNEQDEVELALGVPLDSGVMIIGNLDSLFAPMGKVDTIRFDGNNKPIYSLKNITGECLRGIWTAYYTTRDRDSIYHYTTIGVFEEPIKNKQ